MVATCYAVSVKTSLCYIGYSGKSSLFFQKDAEKRNELMLQRVGTQQLANYGHEKCCAEFSAAYVALTYGEPLESLVFFTMNKDGEPFKPCDQCLDWMTGRVRGWMAAQGSYEYNSQRWTLARADNAEWPKSDLEALQAAARFVENENAAFYKQQFKLVANFS